MTKTAGNSTPDRQKIAVYESSLLVPAGKSSKLMALRNKSQPVSNANNACLPAKANLPGLKPEAAKELMQARAMIDDSINDIMKRFPEAKKNRLFSFRFGSVDAIKALPVTAAFKRLDINSHQLKMGLIADRDYYGKDTRHAEDNI